MTTKTDEYEILLEEVSVGNYVEHKSTKEVIRLTTKNIDIVKYFDPIAITPDWLVDLGFNYIKGDENIWEELKLTYDEEDKELWWMSGLYFLEKSWRGYILYHATDEDCYRELGDFKYVHHLQNFFTALRGDRLMYEPPLKKQFERLIADSELPKNVTEYMRRNDIETFDDLRFHIREKGVFIKDKGLYGLETTRDSAIYVSIEDTKNVDGNYVEVLSKEVFYEV